MLHYEDAGLRLFHGSNKDVLGADALGYPHALGYHLDRLIPDETYDSIVTDPPYELGFMGKGWDSTGIAYDVDLWRECWRVLKPGGHLLSFGGTRTWHRIAAAIEDAGFEIRDSIAWMYGSGFPKSMDVATAVDKLDAAAERRARARRFTAWMREHLTAQRINEITSSAMGSHYVTDKEQPAIATAEYFDRLRPHLPEVPEEIEQLVADRTVESQNWAAREVTGQHTQPAPAQTWRANVLGGEAKGPREKRDRAFTLEAQAWEGWGTALKPAFEPIVVARKPLVGTVAANVLTHGTGALNIDSCRVGTSGGHRDLGVDSRSPESKTAYGHGLNGRPSAPVEGLGRFPANVLLDESQAIALDDQTGILTSGLMKARTERQPRPGGKIYGADKRNIVAGDTYADSGGASRFFPKFALTEADTEWQRRIETLPRFRYEAKAPSSERPEVDGTVHATVKPLELMRWLVRLVTRRGGVVLDPFGGSGTTGEAALLEGMEVDLIEYEAVHLPLILARVRKPLQPSMFGDWEDGAA